MDNIKVSRACYVPIDNIDYFAGYDMNSIKKDVRQKKASPDRIVDCTEGKRTSCVIYLKSGKVVLSPLNPETIQQRIEKGRKEE